MAAHQPPLTFQVDQAALRRLLDSDDGPIAKDLSRRAIRVQRAARRLCPVDTGRLRSSVAWDLRHDARGLLAVIATDVKYARWVELGTSRRHATPFLRPALRAAADGGV